MVTEEQITAYLGLIKTAYPRFYNNISIDEINITIRLWFGIFKDDNTEDLSRAIKYLISTSPYPPTIAEVRQAMSKQKKEDKILNVDKAWEEVMYAVRNFGYNGYKEALESMSKYTREVVNSIGFKEICKSENLYIERAHFIKMYEMLLKREEENNLLPKELKLIKNDTKDQVNKNSDLKIKSNNSTNEKNNIYKNIDKDYFNNLKKLLKSQNLNIKKNI